MLEVWKSGFSKIQLPHVPLTREIVCICMGLSTEETGKRLFPGASPEAANAAMQILFEEELLVLRDKSGSIYPGVIKTMQALAEEYDLFVVSNSQDGYVQSFMRWSGLTCVRDIEMSGRTGLDKGSNIRLVMERNNITQAVNVGDTQKDAAAAEKAGIKPNDIIIRMDGKRITLHTDLTNLLAAHAAGDVVALTVYRIPGLEKLTLQDAIPAGEELELTITLEMPSQDA